MGRNRIEVALLTLFAAALIAASGAFAATPQEIYSDYADNGKLDKAYTPADLDRALKNAAVQAYGKPSSGGLGPAVEEGKDNPSGGGAGGSSGGGTAGGASGGGTAGGLSGGGTAGAQSGEGTSPVQSSGGLPFTGLDLSLIAAGALGLILLGAALRRVARQKA
jgi:hypothetical protein